MTTELPADIAAAIRHLALLCIASAKFSDAMAANRNIRGGIEALEVAILKHLTITRTTGYAYQQDEPGGFVANMKSRKDRP